MTSPNVLSSGTLTGTPVTNNTGEDLGSIEEIMIDVSSGRIAYAVLSFGGILGMGDKLFAIPWEALQYTHDSEHYVLDVPREKLENAEGFNKDNWPDMANPEWHSNVYGYYGYSPYWI